MARGFSHAKPAATKVMQSEATKKAKDRVPEGRGFIASSTPSGGEAPASVRESQNGSAGSSSST